MFARIMPVLRGSARVAMGHIIDCKATPFTPKGWSVEEHMTKGGQLEWNPTRVKLHLTNSQWPGKLVQGYKLRKELEGKLVLNANVLDYLLANPILIPDEWKSGQSIFFWGTIYRDARDYPCVRYLYWGGSKWDWSGTLLKDNFYRCTPAAVLAA